MTDQTVESWFDDADRKGAPSAKLSDKGDWVQGEVVDQFAIPYVKFENRKKPGAEPERDKDGKVIEQLVIVLQTDKRNWDGVKNIPVDVNDNPKPGSEDDGRRAVYVRKYVNIYAAFGEALKAASEAAGRKVQVATGGTLGVQVYDLQDTGQGNPKKLHRIKYVPPVQTSNDGGFFDGASEGKSEQAPPPAQPANQPPSDASAQVDPWTSAAKNEDPPF